MYFVWECVPFHVKGMCSAHMEILQCIREWRDPKSKSEDVASSGVIKKCPLCRAPSQFVIPSSFFCAQGDPVKVATFGKYKASMARVPCKCVVSVNLLCVLLTFVCRWFEKSGKKFCPFGKDCFYQHLRHDGSLHISKHGVTKCIQVSIEPYPPELALISFAGQTIPRTSPTIQLQRELATHKPTPTLQRL